MEMQKQKYVVLEFWGDAPCYQQEYENLSDAAKDYATRDVFLNRSIIDADGKEIAGTRWSKDYDLEGEYFSSDILQNAIVEHERAANANLQPSPRIIADSEPIRDSPNTPPPAAGLDQVTLDRLATRRARDRQYAQELLGQNTIYQDETGREKFRGRETKPSAEARKVSAENISTTNKDPQAVPPEIERQYLRVGNKYFHPKNKDTMVFEDKGHKLETKLSGEQIATSMVAIAAARGWDDIKISGTEAFRKEVWRVAAARGMRIKGYMPSELDKAELAKRMQGIETNRIVNDNAPQQVRAESGVDKQPASAATTPTEPQGEKAKVSDQEKQASTGAILVAHGPAPYLHDKNNSASYYVTTQQGKDAEKTAWGIDLERAITESGAKVGEVVTLKNEGRKPVTVTEHVRDKEGNIIDSFEKVTHRNSWNVTNVTRAEAFKNESPEENVKKHPELAGAHAALAAIDKKAQADGLSVQQRAVVRARAQQNIVNSIERGDLPEMKINEDKMMHREKKKQQEHSPLTQA